MAIDRAELAAALDRRPAVVRVVIAAHRGSTPRGAGTAMLVWAEGQAGTIGGGALEYEAAKRARTLLAGGGPRVERLPLGPGLGQCCGGAVTLIFERLSAVELAAFPECGAHARPVTADAGAMPLAIRRALKAAREEGVAPVLLSGGWLVEPIAAPDRALWIWGAGHVGRALVSVLAPLPDVALTWIDTTPERFPAEVSPKVTVRTHPDPAALVAEAPKTAEHLILTFSHALDLDLCHRLLGHGFTGAGLIGSASKWARFRSRLKALGHTDAQIARIRCPIGDPSLGKHPQAIAVGVAAALLKRDRRDRERDAAG
ncbi:xanthine dehydrogenase accessory protein XdhC [Pararhodobacter sp. SW119]|uniref:xanthine dehydrogenase accessory protein XdhC n=1 Tax=Pararhodobacter sp. SW119 TaxID=2780075 RepID=UPI001ADF2C4A|nr:xanthine dehydrogenase accessory protein XdhC [Pararhodobacter sp. SW119]